MKYSMAVYSEMGDYSEMADYSVMALAVEGRYMDSQTPHTPPPRTRRRTYPRDGLPGCALADLNVVGQTLDAGVRQQMHNILPIDGERG